MIQQQVLHTTATTTTDTASPPTTTATTATSPSIDDPWCQSSPYSILFEPQRASYPTWLFVLSVYHHIPEFRQQFLGVVGERNPAGATGGSVLHQHQRWYINRIHFPRRLLKYRQSNKDNGHILKMHLSVALEGNISCCQLQDQTSTHYRIDCESLT